MSHKRTGVTQARDKLMPYGLRLARVANCPGLRSLSAIFVAVKLRRGLGNATVLLSDVIYSADNLGDLVASVVENSKQEKPT